MIKRYNNLSFIFIPGVALQLLARFKFGESDDPTENALFLALTAVGAALVIGGFMFYARAKGRSPWWGLAGLLSLPGLLILACLKDKSNDPWNT